MIDYNKKIAELSADVGTIWKLQCQNLYNSKNLGALAARECIQNSLDAIKAAVRKGQIPQFGGHIEIDITNEALTITDNGIGMDVKTLHEKFLNLGGTTKGDENNVGGFGLAKAVILGCGTGFKIETQDNVFTSDDLGKNPIQKQAFRQGTKITLYDVQIDKGLTIKDNTDKLRWAILDYICSSDIDVPIKVNGKLYAPYFQTSAKTRRSPAQFDISSTMIPDKTKLKINVFKDKSNSSKYLYIRLRGLTQFKQYLGWNANCNIVLDFQTKIDPRSPEYPFSTNREGLKAQYQGILEAIRDKVAQSPLSISSDDEYKETLYDNVNGSIEQARAITSSVSGGTTVQIASEVSKVIDGIIPQGGHTTPSIADRAKQYNEQLEDVAKEQGITKQQLIKQMSMHTVKKLDNPLEHSWIVWEDKFANQKKLNKSKTVECIVVWDSILRLMASNYSGLNMTIFYPGIVTKKDTLGLCVQKPVNGRSRTYIMMNPFEVPIDNDSQTALFLMGLAAHELAHFSCGTYEAHGETWAYVREAIMNANLQQLENVIKLVRVGKLRKTIAKMAGIQSTTKETCSIDFTSLSMEEIIDMARQYSVDIHSYQDKYNNESILRMRLIMAIKKKLNSEDLE